MDDRQPTLFEDLPIQEAPETGKTTSEPGIPEALKITNETLLEPATPEIAKSTVERILEHITNRLPNPLSVVKPALIENPTDPELLILDLVIVDEAHHLKNRATNNWKLVDALQKRFLLLLSATPVQNSLVELCNLLTLLKPGIFKTEKEFRSTEHERSSAFGELGEKMADAKRQYEAVKVLDENLFGDEFVAA